MVRRSTDGSRRNPPATYLAAQSAVSGAKTPGAVHKMGVCNYMTRETHDIMPISAAQRYEFRYMGGNVKIFSTSEVAGNEVSAHIRRPPKHGTLEPVGTIGSERYEYRYIPNLVENGRGNQEYYYGKDQFAIEVSAGGVNVQVHYTLGVEVGEPSSFVDGDGVVKTPPRFIVTALVAKAGGSPCL